MTKKIGVAVVHDVSNVLLFFLFVVQPTTIQARLLNGGFLSELWTFFRTSRRPCRMTKKIGVAVVHDVSNVLLFFFVRCSAYHNTKLVF